MIGLTDGEIQKLLGFDDGDMRLMCCRTEVFSFKEGAKAQLKKMVEWIEEHNDIDAPGKIYSPFEYFRPYIRHSDWQAILEEVKE